MSSHPLFIHNPLFRLISPLVTGGLVYVLILLINNNVDQLEEQFLTRELYVCIGLSYAIQELSRLSLMLFDRKQSKNGLLRQILQQLGINIVLCVGLVSLVIYLYYTYALGFAPNLTELVIFNSIFSCITLIYMSLQLSHHFLFAVNTQRLERELQLKEEVEADFKDFSQGINPQLLFESFDQLIVLAHKDIEQAEMLIDYLANMYRYVLTKRKEELVSLEEEIIILNDFLSLFNLQPYRKVRLITNESIQGHIPTACLLNLIERIIRSSILDSEEELLIRLDKKGAYMQISYDALEKTTEQLNIDQLSQWQDRYSIYSSEELYMDIEGRSKVIGLPILHLSESAPLSSQPDHP